MASQIPGSDPGPNLSAAISATGDGVAMQVKVVPGASRSRIMGLLGDRIKVAVSAPPEGGRANRAVCELLAQVLGVSASNVLVTAGASQPRKTITVIGLSLCAATEKMGKAMGRKGE